MRPCALICIMLRNAVASTLRRICVGVLLMGVHGWAQQELQRGLEAARQAGYEPQLYLRALLSAVVEQSKQGRAVADLAQELRFLADNLDDGRDYGFMRP
jgi:hypothetical protein